jgi:Na+:H+ antiporter, NhaA family
MKATKLFNSFFESEKAGGILLLFCTLLSIILSNSFLGNTYSHFWQTKIGGFTLVHFINDGLMMIFFLMIGLELERELYIGELSKIKNALLPFFAAIGGMIVPALIYLFFNYNTVYQNGIGIPMATDIAFAVAILSLLGNKVPISLKIFVIAIAVIDDLGAIIVIALFYSKDIQTTNLLISLAIFGILLIMNILKIYKLCPYLIGGFFMWYFMLHSGVHATITGVLLAFAIPFEKGEEQSISYKLQQFLHKPVSFVILPIFALANTAIVLNFGQNQPILSSCAFGIILGLTLGKPLGISFFSYLSIKLKIAKKPTDLSYKLILGAGILGGIGFTMSIFITLLAFSDVHIINNAKLYIILASVLSSVIGLLFLKKVLVSKN